MLFYSVLQFIKFLQVPVFSTLNRTDITLSQERLVVCEKNPRLTPVECHN